MSPEIGLRGEIKAKLLKKFLSDPLFPWEQITINKIWISGLSENILELFYGCVTHSKKKKNTHKYCVLRWNNFSKTRIFSFMNQE